MVSTLPLAGHQPSPFARSSSRARSRTIPLAHELLTLARALRAFISPFGYPSLVSPFGSEHKKFWDGHFMVIGHSPGGEGRLFMEVSLSSTLLNAQFFQGVYHFEEMNLKEGNKR